MPLFRIGLCSEGCKYFWHISQFNWGWNKTINRLLKWFENFGWYRQRRWYFSYLRKGIDIYDIFIIINYLITILIKEWTSSGSYQTENTSFERCFSFYKTLFSLALLPSYNQQEVTNVSNQISKYTYIHLCLV